MIKFKIRKGDLVKVVTGADRGHVGEVVSMIRSRFRVVVKGANVFKRCVSPTKDKPGHVDSIEMPIHISNVMLVDQSDMKSTRIGYKYDSDGKKVRYSKRTKQAV